MSAATPIVAQPIPVPETLEDLRGTLGLVRASLAPRTPTPDLVEAYNAVGYAIVALERQGVADAVEEVTA